MQDGKTIRILKRMNRIILSGYTGTPEEFAAKLGLQRSGLYFYFNIMKANGVPIKYSRTLRSYYYEAEGGFFVGFLTKDIINVL